MFGCLLINHVGTAEGVLMFGSETGLEQHIYPGMSFPWDNLELHEGEAAGNS